LLPGSVAPAVVRLRRRLADGLRMALIARRDPDLLADWAHAPWGEEDLDVWRALAAVRPTAAVRARLSALESELSAPRSYSTTPSRSAAQTNSAAPAHSAAPSLSAHPPRTRPTPQQDPRTSATHLQRRRS
jgi:hypothetical protein